MDQAVPVLASNPAWRRERDRRMRERAKRVVESLISAPEPAPGVVEAWQEPALDARTLERAPAR